MNQQVRRCFRRWRSTAANLRTSDVKATLARLGLIGAVLTMTACHSKPPAVPGTGPDGAATLEQAPPTRAEFPELVLKLLTTKADDPKQRADLVRVVQYQLARGADLYKKEQDEAGASVTLGALLLLRDIDDQKAALRGHAVPLLRAAEGAARLGDSGQAAALYRLALAQTSDARARQNIEEHLKAMVEFDRRTTSELPLAKAGEKARHELVGAIRDGSKAQYEEAQKATISWIQMALALDQEPPRGLDEHKQREHALEEYRALRGGGLALLALALRQGEPGRAIDALDAAGLRRIVPTKVRSDVLLAAAGESAGYLELYRLFDAARRAEVGEAGLPRPILDAAVFWSAVLAAKTSPGDVDEMLPLAVSLVEIGIGEAAARLLARVSAEELSQEGLSFCLSILGRGLVDHAQAGRIEEAEQVFTEMQPLLRLARTSKYEGVEPGPTKVTRVLAEAEVRSGRLKEALPLLKAVASESPSPNVFLEIAAIHRQSQDPEGALAAIEQGIELARAEGQLYLEAVGETERFELERELGHTEEASASLRRALDRILTVRSLDLPVLSRAAIERHLARILEHYGERDGVHRAFERALDESRGFPFELTATLTEMARASVTMSDLKLARTALRSGVELGVESEGLLYLALWQLIVERTSGAASNGLPEQVLEASGDLRGWLRDLRQWGLGRLSGGDLMQLADTTTERIEGAFYAAILEPKSARDSALLRIAQSEAIGLIEVQIARALQSPQDRYELPKEIAIP